MDVIYGIKLFVGRSRWWWWCREGGAEVVVVGGRGVAMFLCTWVPKYMICQQIRCICIHSSSYTLFLMIIIKHVTPNIFSVWITFLVPINNAKKFSVTFLRVDAECIRYACDRFLMHRFLDQVFRAVKATALGYMDGEVDVNYPKWQWK